MFEINQRRSPRAGVCVWSRSLFAVRRSLLPAAFQWLPAETGRQICQNRQTPGKRMTN